MIPSGVYIHPMSITMSDHNSLMLSKPSSANSKFQFQDHYAILELDMFATSEEIKLAFRRLRGEYFRTDGVKYRALQAAYEVLVDIGARYRYDNMYRVDRGFPARPPLKQFNTESTAQREACPNSSQLTPSPGLVQDPASEAARTSPTVDPPPQTKNHASKDYRQSRKVASGSRQYRSRVPIAGRYQRKEENPRSRSSPPRYVLDTAQNSLP
jgi:curved DNA-binding protein CbpA